jgi:hypothetical protein
MKRKRVTVEYVSSGLNAGQFSVRVNGKSVQLRSTRDKARAVATLYRKNAHRDALAKRLRKTRKK